MDLFRYSSPGTHQLSVTPPRLFFSPDNGNHVYYYWNTHANGFDVNGDLDVPGHHSMNWRLVTSRQSAERRRRPLHL
jgi:hypothetical protein